MPFITAETATKFYNKKTKKLKSLSPAAKLEKLKKYWQTINEMKTSNHNSALHCWRSGNAIKVDEITRSDNEILKILKEWQTAITKILFAEIDEAIEEWKNNEIDKTIIEPIIKETNDAKVSLVGIFTKNIEDQNQWKLLEKQIVAIESKIDRINGWDHNLTPDQSAGLLSCFKGNNSEKNFSYIREANNLQIEPNKKTKNNKQNCL